MALPHQEGTRIAVAHDLVPILKPELAARDAAVLPATVSFWIGSYGFALIEFQIPPLPPP